MFEQQIEKTIALVTERTIGTDNSIKLNRILESDIIAPLKTFFSADVDEWMGGELQRLLESPHFDYTVPDLRATLEELNVRSKMHAVYKREEFLQALERGIKLLFNYTCRPQWTQTKFVFNDLQKVAVPDIFRSLRYFSDYPYYKTILEKYFSKRDIAEFPVTKFDELLSLIDQEVVKNFNSSQMAELTFPIYQLFGMDADPAGGVVPLEALQIFFDDKGNSAIVERLQKEHEEKGDIAVSMHDLKFLIADVEFAIGVEISELVTRHVVAPEQAEAIFPGAVPREEDREEMEKAFQTAAEPIVSPFQPLEESAFAMESTPEGFEEPHVAESFETEGPGPVFEVPEEGIELPLEVHAEKEAAVHGTPYASAPALEGAEARLGSSPGFDSLEAEFDKAFGAQEAAPASGVTPGLQETIASAEQSYAVPDIATSFATSGADPMQIESTLSTPLGPPTTPEPAVPDFSFAPGQQPPAPPAAAPAMPAQPAASPFDTAPSLDAVTRFGDLRKTISQREQKKFVKKIFGRSDDRFNTALDVLNNKPTWKEASEYIDEIFLTNNVDMYSRIAVQFTDEIYKRYLQKK